MFASAEVVFGLMRFLSERFPSAHVAWHLPFSNLMIGHLTIYSDLVVHAAMAIIMHVLHRRKHDVAFVEAFSQAVTTKLGASQSKRSAGLPQLMSPDCQSASSRVLTQRLISLSARQCTCSQKYGKRGFAVVPDSRPAQFKR